MGLDLVNKHTFTNILYIKTWFFDFTVGTCIRVQPMPKASYLPWLQNSSTILISTELCECQIKGDNLFNRFCRLEGNLKLVISGF